MTGCISPGETEDESKEDPQIPNLIILLIEAVTVHLGDQKEPLTAFNFGTVQVNSETGHVNHEGNSISQLDIHVHDAYCRDLLLGSKVAELEARSTLAYTFDHTTPRTVCRIASSGRISLCFSRAANDSTVLLMLLLDTFFIG